MRRLLLPIALLVLCGAAVAEEEASPAGSKTFQGWTGTCNNLGACVAIGATDADTFFYLRIARDAGATAPPQVKLVIATPDVLKGNSPAFALTAKGTPKSGAGSATSVALGPFPATTDARDVSQYTAIIAAGAASLAAIDAVRDADTLDYALLDAKGTLDLSGLSATLRWIDAQQGRAGTPTALVAKGMTPIGQVPEPREAPTIIAAAAGSASEIAKPVLTKAVLDKAAALEDCDKETVQAHQDAQAWQLGADLMLVAVPCINGAYNFSVALYFTDANGEAPRAVPLPKPAGGDEGTAGNVLTNMSFDPATMTLSDLAKGRGIGDCGEARQWIWTGQSFALLDASRLDACPGAMEDDWPNTYSARRK